MNLFSYYSVVKHVYSKEKPWRRLGGSVPTHTTRMGFCSSVKSRDGVRSEPISQPLSGAVDLVSFLLCENRVVEARLAVQSALWGRLAHGSGLWVLSGQRLHLLEHKIQLYWEC